jgi:DNA-binding IclR family transcriptional regulator
MGVSKKRRSTARPGGAEVAGTQALARGVAVLEVLAGESAPLDIEQVAERVGVPLSTAYRIVRYLAQVGLVEHREQGRVALGLRLLDLARVTRLQVESGLLGVARPVMRELAQRTQETAMLMAPTGGQAICLEYIESPRPIRLSFERGRVMPLYAGAAGKVLLAFLDDRERNRALAAAEGAELENGRVVSSDELSVELAEIGRAGYCVSEGEVNIDTVGVAAPVFRRRRLVAGLTVAGPSRRFTEKYLSEMVAAVVSAAQEIGRRLEQAVVDGVRGARKLAAREDDSAAEGQGRR